MRYGSFFPKEIFNPEILIYPLSLVISPAILFTPFIFYVLIKEKRRAWIITFLVMVVLPYLLILPIAYENFFNVQWMTILIAPFYFYCFLMKKTADEWISEYEAHELRKEQKKEKERLQKAEEGWR